MAQDRKPFEASSRENDEPELRALDEAIQLEELRLSLRATFDTRKLSSLKAARRDLVERGQSLHR